MRVFKDVGLVEQLGSGMNRILRYYDKSIWGISEHFVKVVFPFFILDEEENIANGDNNSVRELFALLEKEPYITAREMSAYTGFSTRKISRIMRELRETGRIVRVGSPRKGYWKIRDRVEE